MRRILTPIGAICLVAALQGAPAEARGQQGPLLKTSNQPDQPGRPTGPTRLQGVLAGLAGTWQGVCSYPERGRDPVAFTMTLEVRGDTCRGRTEEPNTFGAPSVTHLYATWSAKWSTARFRRV
jgi:hypothetical protein